MDLGPEADPGMIPDEEAVFHAARRIPDARERAAYLDSACDGNRALRARLSAMLRVHDDQPDFLETPPVAYPPATAAAGPLHPPEGPGAAIGPYLLMEPLGEGGMGSVYVAEQSSPVRRPVALKVIKPGMDSRRVIARFEAERQALALMDHPGIARVFDGGTTPSGRPYFVMELVRGTPITAYCRERGLPIAERLRLFEAVCRAVQHAHQKGIIHRDLKPSNILVAEHDGHALPKVIDFGIAKATGPALAETEVDTGVNLLIGTPLFMSPEQFDLAGQDVDTRSDIYSLGVLLYELLTGLPPFDPEALRGLPFDELRRIVREQEPTRPSLRLEPRRRRGEDRRLRRAIRGELDWIVLKALEKDRDRRYASANDLADDLVRYRNNRPVEAGPPSTAYRLKKFVRRNRALLGTATLCGLTSMVIAAGGLYLAHQRASLLGAAAEAIAEADALARSGDRERELNVIRRAEAILESGLVDFGPLRAVRERRGQIETALRLGELRLAVADATRGVTTARNAAEAHFAEAFAGLGIDPLAEPPQDVAAKLPAGKVREDFAAVLDQWARVRYQARGACDDACRRLLAAANAVDGPSFRSLYRDALMGDDPRTLRRLQHDPDLATPHPSLAILLTWGEPPEALWRRLREEQLRRPGDFWLSHELAVHHEQGPSPKLDDAIAYHRAALAARPESPGARLSLGRALEKAGRGDDARACYRQALLIQANDPAVLNAMAELLLRGGKVAEAIETYWRAIRVSPEYGLAHYNLARAILEHGEPIANPGARRWQIEGGPVLFSYRDRTTVESRDDLDRIEARLRDGIRRSPGESRAHLDLGEFLATHRLDPEAAIACFRRAIAADPRLADAHYRLGLARLARGEAAEAVAALREAVNIAPWRADMHSGLGKALARNGDLDGALLESRYAVALDPHPATHHLALGVAQALRGQGTEAEASIQRAIRCAPRSPEPHLILGNVRLARNDWRGAEAASRDALKLANDHPEALATLGTALLGQGRTEEAGPVLALAHELGSKSPKWPYPSASWARLGPPGPPPEGRRSTH